jgi:SOS-response transcriptional repressor LexA
MTDSTEARKNVLRNFLQEHGGFARVVERYGLTQSQASYLSQLTAQDSTASFGERAAKNWEERLRIQDSRLVNAGRASASANVAPAPMGGRRVPVITSIQAGMWAEIVDNFQPGDAGDWLLTDIDLSGSAFALDIRGNSMEPEFKDGDRVIIDPEIAPQPGDFVAAKNGEQEATFKKYRPRGMDAQGNMIFELVPLNDDYPTLRSDVQPIRIVGTMVEHRKYRRPR